MLLAFVQQQRAEQRKQWLTLWKKQMIQSKHSLFAWIREPCKQSCGYLKRADGSKTASPKELFELIHETWAPFLQSPLADLSRFEACFADQIKHAYCAVTFPLITGERLWKIVLTSRGSSEISKEPVACCYQS